MQKIFILFLLILTGADVSNLMAQKVTLGNTRVDLKPSNTIVLDTTILRCQYRQVIVLDRDTLNKRWLREDNIMLLQIGKNMSKYFDFNVFLADSIYHSDLAEGLDAEKIINRSLARTANSTRAVSYKNYPESKITNVDYFAFQDYKYEEELKPQDWTITNDTLTVLGYLCHKATTKLGGRYYTVWYSPDIPVSNGPWKFTGLPGLILKVRDDKKEIYFDCISLEQITWNDKIKMPDTAYFRTTKEKYYKAKASYMENPAAFIYGHELTPANLPAQASKKIPYNPIELDY